MCSRLQRRAASRVQAAGRRSNAALNFKEKMVFNLNTPLPSVECSIYRLTTSTVDCGTDRAGADASDCESRPSQGADSYDTAMGDGLEKRSIVGTAYVLTWAWCFLGAISTTGLSSRWNWWSKCECLEYGKYGSNV